MTEAHVTFSASRPRVGDLVHYEGRDVGPVSSVDGNLCWVAYDGKPAAPFIWCFKDGLNALHTWPTKRATDALTFCPGVSR